MKSSQGDLVKAHMGCTSADWHARFLEEQDDCGRGSWVTTT